MDCLKKYLPNCLFPHNMTWYSSECHIWWNKQIVACKTWLEHLYSYLLILVFTQWLMLFILTCLWGDFHFIADRLDRELFYLFIFYCSLSQCHLSSYCFFNMQRIAVNLSTGKAAYYLTIPGETQQPAPNNILLLDAAFLGDPVP